MLNPRIGATITFRTSSDDRARIASALQTLRDRGAFRATQSDVIKEALRLYHISLATKASG